ncbi:MAG: hypothetical protein HZA46_24410 [Planctomycetales bacterium]|nr:hypothetical protein [Planctomycetales bacterium]
MGLRAWLNPLLGDDSRSRTESVPDGADTLSPTGEAVDDLRPTPEDLGFHGVTSRYTDIPEVEIDMVKVPEDLRHLIPHVKHWCIGDDVERSNLMWLTPPEELSAFVAAVWPFRDAITSWCQSQNNLTPVPDEVIAFDMMMEAMAEAIACHTDAPEGDA